MKNGICDKLLVITCLLSIISQADTKKTSVIKSEASTTKLEIQDVTDKKNLVGINYSTWHSLAFRRNQPIRNIQKIHSGKGKFGYRGSWHFWAEPAVGYYRGDNAMVMDYHFELFEEAKIDFIILDVTNIYPKSKLKDEYIYKPFEVMVKVMRDRQQAGKESPRIVMWSPGVLAEELDERYFSKPEYDDLWLYLDDGQGAKPLFLSRLDRDQIPQKLNDQLTIRTMWGLRSKPADREWSFLMNYPQTVATCDGKPEQLVVCTALQKNYMSNEKSGTSREQGKTFQRQWSRAFEIRPKFIVITWWNELIAQRQKDGKDGQVQFVDMFRPEYSRDIEPVKEPYGDMYFRFMRDYIKAYKKGEQMPMDLLEALDKGSDREDFDMDGIPNSVEGSKDSDGDGISDQWDLDSNNDGIPDSKKSITKNEVE
jgi:hypothetical protein